MYKIAIVDDENLFAKGIELILLQAGKFDIPFIGHSGRAFLDFLNSTEEELDVVLLDLSMPELDGVDTLIELNKLPKYPKVVVLSSHYNPGIIVKMITEGASSFLNKNESPEEVIKTVLNVAERGYYFNNYVFEILRTRRLLASNDQKTFNLSDREIEILKLICEECTNKEIGEKLFISPRTVEGHRNNMLEKTSSKNTAGLIIYAIEHDYYKVKISRYN